MGDDDSEESIVLRPLEDIYFFKEAQFESGIKHGNKAVVNAFIIIAIFSFIASLIVFNTVRIAIYTHRDEIKIMKLVGATNWFIRAPFLLEEFFYASISLLILMSFFYPLLNQPVLLGQLLC